MFILNITKRCSFDARKGSSLLRELLLRALWSRINVRTHYCQYFCLKKSFTDRNLPNCDKLWISFGQTSSRRKEIKLKKWKRFLKRTKYQRRILLLLDFHALCKCDPFGSFLAAFLHRYRVNWIQIRRSLLCLSFLNNDDCFPVLADRNSMESKSTLNISLQWSFTCNCCFFSLLRVWTKVDHGVGNCHTFRNYILPLLPLCLFPSPWVQQNIFK